jgi:rhodanese-related sulfurtransferase
MEREADLLDPAEVRERIARKEAVVLDLQADDRWRRAHLVGATHVSHDDIGGVLEHVPKEQPIIVVCGDGERSREVAEKLTSDGRQASAISGGMDAWLSAGFHVQPSPDPDPRRDEASG